MAELVETPHGGFSNADGHFEIRVTAASEKHPQSETIYTSPDEGVDARRFLWSNDGRYLLMVGKDLGVGPGDVTDKGEMLYLLYDSQKHELRCNSPQLSAPVKHFDFRDLVGINFGEKFRPEKLN